MAYCLGCFRDVEKSPFSMFCPECQLNETVKREAETTRRQMREQERRQQKEHSMRAQQEYNQKLKNERKQRERDRERERAEDEARAQNNLHLLTIKHDDLKDFNLKASKALEAGSTDKLVKCQNSADKWSYEDVEVCQNELFRVKSSPAINAFIKSLDTHREIRQVLVLLLLARKKLNLNPSTEPWLNGSFLKDEKVLIEFVENAEAAACKKFSENFKWLNLPTETLEKVLVAMMKPDNLDRWDTACQKIYDLIIDYNLSLELKENSTLAIVVKRASELKKRKQCLFAMTALATKEPDFLETLKTVDLEDLLTEAFEKDRDKEEHNIEGIYSYSKEFFQTWKKYTTKDSPVFRFITQSQKEVQNRLLEIIEKIRSDNDQKRIDKLKERDSCKEREMLEFKKRCLWVNPYIRCGGMPYYKVGLMKGKELESVFEYVRSNQDQVGTEIRVPSVLTFLLLSIFELGAFFNFSKDHYYTEPAEKESIIPNLFFAGMSFLIALLFLYAAKNADFLVLIFFWYGIKNLVVTHAISQFRRMTKIENMRFETNLLDRELDKICSELSQARKLSEQVQKAA